MEKIEPVNQSRLLSLDVFRGITIAMMILVNNMGSHEYVYPQLGHSDWNGCTLTDLVFPFFLFIIGVSICFAMDKKRYNTPHREIIAAAARRSMIMIGLSFVLFLFPKVFTAPIDAILNLRIQGILFRIAIVYFLATLIFIKTKLGTQIILGILFLVGYWCVLSFIPVPGIGAANYGKDTNMGAYLDRGLFGTSHLLHKTWDPQALLGTIPSIATVIMGIVTGHILRNSKYGMNRRCIHLLVLGLSTIMLGIAWGQFFPINKSLWTSSYVLYTGGLACVGLSASYYLIDIKGIKVPFLPFLALGRNAITLYFLSELLPRILNIIPIKTSGGSMDLRTFIYHKLLQPIFESPYLDSLASGIFYMLLFTALAWWMYKKDIMIKI
ncbi:acyltransferase family protein [Pedobacter ginsenosidimutans]|nr:heparan-alpha-glucosaminide N-acetyltransferase domain-containing protein [Pedobacter ginsenosidimutans]